MTQDEKKTYNKEYYEQNKERELERCREYRRKNRDEIRERRRAAYRRKHPRKNYKITLQRLDKERVPKRPMQYNTTTSDELHDKMLRWAFTQWRKYISGRTPGSIKLMHEADREYYAKRVRNYDAITLALETELDIGSRNMIYQKQRTIEQDIYNWATNHKSGV